ncbi:MAG: sulfotransferase family 2 domain-containing protein [Candidatus Helarchaeota archaeon]
MFLEKLEYMNRISHNKKAIFCHIPKCGGTSTESILSNWERIKHIPEVLKYKEFIGTGGYLFLKYSEKILEEYYIFTITRNPYDRFISGFLDFHKSIIHQGTKDIKYFQENYMLKTLKISRPLLKYHLDEHFIKTQTEIIGKLYPFINDFFKLEEIDKIIKKFKSLGINVEKYPIKRTTKMINSKKRKFWITDEVKKYIDEKYAEDFKNFHYLKKL